LDSFDSTTKTFRIPLLTDSVSAGFPSPADDYTEENIDLTVNILCRDKVGKRLEIYDLELELFKSNKELVFVISKLNFPDEPILWCGVKTLWMDSNKWKKCISPIYSARLENLANRIKSFID